MKLIMDTFLEIGMHMFLEIGGGWFQHLLKFTIVSFFEISLAIFGDSLFLKTEGDTIIAIYDAIFSVSGLCISNVTTLRGGASGTW